MLESTVGGLKRKNGVFLLLQPVHGMTVVMTIAFGRPVQIGMEQAQGILCRGPSISNIRCRTTFKGSSACFIVRSYVQVVARI